MAVAGLSQGLMTGLWFGSLSVIGYVAAGGALWYWIVRPSEEPDLSDRFGPEFDRYRSEVSCWVPRSTPFR